MLMVDASELKTTKNHHHLNPSKHIHHSILFTEFAEDLYALRWMYSMDQGQTKMKTGTAESESTTMPDASSSSSSLLPCRTRSSLHLNRRFQHMMTGLVFYALSYILPHGVACILLVFFTSAFYALHIARSKYKSKAVQKAYIKHFGTLLREDEKYNIHYLPGAFWFLLGTTMTVLLFPMGDKNNIARISLLCLSFGDPIAAMVGVYLGGPSISRKGRQKTLGGSLACFIVCYAISCVLLGDENIGHTDHSMACYLTGIAASMMEGASLFCSIDDNILIPVGTGTSLWFYLRA